MTAMTASPAPNSESITLADGRTLCFARYGAPGGRPVIYLHGAGSSRLEGAHYDAAARAAGVEIIATDRPGCAHRAARESLRQPESGYVAQEVRLGSSDWGFDHAAITQPVEIFSGDRDAGYRYARVWASLLPVGRLHVFAGGHADFATPEARDRIVAAMASAP